MSTVLNREAASKGLFPQLPDGNFAALHHLGQKTPGPLTEGSTRYHGVAKPGQYMGGVNHTQPCSLTEKIRRGYSRVLEIAV